MSEAVQLEPPPVSVSDSDQLKSNFNTQLQAEVERTTGAPIEEKIEVTKPVEVKKVEEDSLIPSELMGSKEVKKPAEEPLVSDEVRNAMKGAARSNFDKLEKAAQARIDALRAELAAAKAKPAVTTDVEPILAEAKVAKERAAQLEVEFERVAYTQSPKFQKFGTEEGAEIKSAKSYLEGGEVNPAIIDAAANTMGAARMKILRDAGLDAETIAVLSPHLARVDAIRRERDQSLEGWKANVAQDQQRAQLQQQQEHQQRVAQEKAVFTQVMDEMKNDPAFTRVDGRDKWNAIVEQNFKDAEDFAHGHKPLAELFKLGIDGVSARTTRMMNQELTKRCNELTAEVGRLKAAQPGVGKSGEEVVRKAAPNETKDQTEHWKNSFNAAKQEVAANGFNLQ